MAVRIEPQATTEAALAAERIFGRRLDEVDEPAMGLVQLPSHRGEGQTRLLLGHPGVEGIDAAERDGVPRWRAALEDERQVRQRLLFPRAHVGEDVSDRRRERSPRRVESLQQSPSIHRLRPPSGTSG